VSQHPQAALEIQRRRRRWRPWPWGPIALGLALLSVSGVFAIGMLFGAGMRPSSAGGPVVNLMPFVIALAVAEVLTISAGLFAAVLGWRLNRGRVTAALAMVVLSLWAGILLHDLL
jgi:hypothetical protein